MPFEQNKNNNVHYVNVSVLKFFTKDHFFNLNYTFSIKSYVLDVY